MRIVSAIAVITQEDRYRSGAANNPDPLRMAPGVGVAETNANTWPINVRGFHARFSNNLLELLGRRPAYTEAFGGICRDDLGLTLAKYTDRIEVTLGLGGSVWSANAINDRPFQRSERAFLYEVGYSPHPAP